jgi:magnesium chelatase subunit I
VTGKVELVYEGEQEGAIKVARHLIGNACRAVFDRYFPDVIKEGSEPKLKTDRYKPILDWFAAGERLDLSDDMSDKDYVDALDGVPGLKAVVAEFLPQDVPVARAAAMELVLEGLHQHSLVAKEELSTGASYSDMLGIMLEGLK